MQKYKTITIKRVKLWLAHNREFFSFKKKKVEIKDETLRQYLDRLFAEIDEQFKAWKKWSKLELIAMMTFLISLIVLSSAMAVILSFNLWFIILITKHNFVDKKLDRAFGEMDGAITILRHLGLLDKEPPRGKKDKKNKRELFKQVKETWERLKQGVPQLSPQLMVIKNGDI